MAAFVLHIMSYMGTVPWAKHYTGRVEGEHPESCHGGTRFNGQDGPLKDKTTCFEGHELPERVEWSVEAPWTEGKYKRWAAKHFEGDGPNQYLDEADLVQDAIGRFTGTLPCSWWEQPVPAAEPGDELYLDYATSNPDHRYPDGAGHLLARIPGNSADVYRLGTARDLAALSRGEG